MGDWHTAGDICWLIVAAALALPVAHARAPPARGRRYAGAFVCDRGARITRNATCRGGRDRLLWLLADKMAVINRGSPMSLSILYLSVRPSIHAIFHPFLHSTDH